MDTDIPIKVLFERQGQSLLPFIGEAGARLAGVDAVELPAGRRTVDSVLRLERDGLTWYRHLEFQAEHDATLPRRCFEYNARLVLHLTAPVVTTVVYLLPGADRDLPDAFRLYVGGRLVNEWRFDVVRLWEIDVGLALESGQAGPLALVPLLRGGDRQDVIREAVHRLAALPSRDEARDVFSVLIELACRRYDRHTVERLFGKDRIMQESWVYRMGLDEGAVVATRAACADLVKELHPRVAGRLLRRIGACSDVDTLRGWIRECPKVSDAAFVRLVTGGAAASVLRSRAGRPARAARRPAASRKRR